MTNSTALSTRCAACIRIRPGTNSYLYALTQHAANYPNDTAPLEDRALWDALHASKKTQREKITRRLLDADFERADVLTVAAHRLVHATALFAAFTIQDRPDVALPAHAFDADV
jgi:hypothetical protein